MRACITRACYQSCPVPCALFRVHLGPATATDGTACPRAEPFKSHSSPARPSAFVAGSGSSTPCARVRTARCTSRSRGEVTGRARLCSGPTTTCEGGWRPGSEGKSDQRQVHQASGVEGVDVHPFKATRRAANRRCLRGGVSTIRRAEAHNGPVRVMLPNLAAIQWALEAYPHPPNSNVEDGATEQSATAGFDPEHASDLNRS